MGRRKIEIRPIKDDRNRSVTFLKRKAGLMKKAHELSVLCSVDVAVIVFGNNRKVYEYSSSNMNNLIGRYQCNGGAHERKGPSDFNGGDDGDEDDEGEPSPPGPPHSQEGMDTQMMPPQLHGQQPPFPHIISHNTPSASPPIPNGARFPSPVPPRQPSPQPSMGGSRPGSSGNGVHRPGTSMASQQMAVSQAPHPGVTYLPTPPIYHPNSGQTNMMPPLPSLSSSGHGYAYAAHPSQHQYSQDRHLSAPPGYTTHHPQPGLVAAHRTESPPQPPPNHIAPPPPPSDRRAQDAQMPAPPEVKTERRPPQPPQLNTGSAVKKMPQRKSHSIFTPIEEDRSILSRHTALFASEQPGLKPDASPPGAFRSQSVDISAAAAVRDASRPSPPQAQPQLRRSQTVQNGTDRGQAPPPPPDSVAPTTSTTTDASPASEAAATPLSRSNSLKPINGGSRTRGPRLTVQIPDGASEPSSAGGEANSPRNVTDITSQAPRANSLTGIVLPPPASPSASALLSAGATGPPNPFARPPPQQTVNGETPVSALPSRFMNGDLLPSPSSFYQDWNFRSTDSNTLPSPLNFATPVVGSGPSFLKDDHNYSSSHAGATATTSSGGSTAATSTAAPAAPAATGAEANQVGPGKRKSPEQGSGEPAGAPQAGGDAKRVKT